MVSCRLDGKGGKHFNLIQLPLETEIDPRTSLSLDYQVVVFFERPTTDFTHDEIFTRVIERLTKMDIPLGNGMAKPIYLPCKERKKNSKQIFWTRPIKLHLKNSKVDGINLLKGLRPFILLLDEDTPTLGKVCKIWDLFARNSSLSTKIDDPKLNLVTACELHRDVLRESFRRRFDYEICNVQEVKEETWRWLISTTPIQANKIIQHLVPF